MGKEIFCMDILTDEHEREEAVRKWWHEHWKPIALGVAIALLGLVAVRQYQAYDLSQKQETAYEVYQLQNQLQSRGAAAFTDAQKFLDEHDDIYGAILSLDMANVMLRANNYSEASKYVDFAKKNGGELMAPQTTLVEARLQAQNAQYDQALATLDSIKSEAYKAEIFETRGDVFMAQNKTDEAHDAYLQAIKLLQEAKLQISPMLQMKFDNVIKPGDTPAYKLMAEQAQEAAATIQQAAQDPN